MTFQLYQNTIRHCYDLSSVSYIMKREEKCEENTRKKDQAKKKKINKKYIFAESYSKISGERGTMNNYRMIRNLLVGLV